LTDDTVNELHVHVPGLELQKL